MKRNAWQLRLVRFSQMPFSDPLVMYMEVDGLNLKWCGTGTLLLISSCKTSRLRSGEGLELRSIRSGVMVTWGSPLPMDRQDQGQIRNLPKGTQTYNFAIMSKKDMKLRTFRTVGKGMCLREWGCSLGQPWMTKDISFCNVVGCRRLRRNFENNGLPYLLFVE